MIVKVDSIKPVFSKSNLLKYLKWEHGEEFVVPDHAKVIKVTSSRHYSSDDVYSIFKSLGLKNITIKHLGYTYLYNSMGLLCKELVSGKTDYVCVYWDNGKKRLEKDYVDTVFATKEYNEAGSIVRETRASGRVFTWEYDDCNRLLASDSHGIIIKNTYGSNGLLLESSRNGTITKYEYNSDGLEIKKTHVLCYTPCDDDLVETREYDSEGRLSKKVNTSKQVYTYKYSNGNTSEYNNGKLVRVEDKNGKPSFSLGHMYEYDDLGNITKEIYTNGYTVENEYDSFGNLTKTINDGVRAMTCKYNEYGILVSKQYGDREPYVFNVKKPEIKFEVIE